MALIVNYLEQSRSSGHVLLFSNSNKKDKTDRLFRPLLGFKNGHKDKECSQTTDVCIKIVSCYRRQYSLFSDL